MIEELEPAGIALVVDWCWGLHVREGGVLLRVGVLRVVVVVIGGEGLLAEWVLHGVNWRLRVGRAAVEELLLETIETGSEIDVPFGCGWVAASVSAIRALLKLLLPLLEGLDLQRQIPAIRQALLVLPRMPAGHNLIIVRVMDAILAYLTLLLLEHRIEDLHAKTATASMMVSLRKGMISWVECLSTA